jgi:hypothetical protein
MILPDTLPPAVIPHYTWHQVDSSKLLTYRSCPREYFFRYLLGWAVPTDSIHLVVGTAWHLAMEYISQHTTEPTRAAKGFDLFLTELRKHFPPAFDESLGPKGPGNVQLALKQYAERYAGDSVEWDTLHIEVPATATIGPDRALSGRMDLVRRSKQDGLVRVFDHKTTSQDSFGWRNQWTLSLQLGTYIHALYCVYEPGEVWGAVIDGAILRQARSERGTSKGNDFTRLEVRRTPDQQAAWLSDVNLWWDRIEADLALLGKASSDDPVLRAFPKNDGHCVRYNSLCPYHALCVLQPNPLVALEQARDTGTLPLGMEERFWDAALHESVSPAGQPVQAGYSSEVLNGASWLTGGA